MMIQTNSYSQQLPHLQEDFYQRLTDFIATENGAQFLGDLAFVNNDPSEQLISARSTFQWRFIDDTQEQV